MSSEGLSHLHLTETEFQALPREEQERYLTILDEEVRLRKSRKILFYVPNPKLKEFHLSEAPIRAIFGGNRLARLLLVVWSSCSI